jgi:hypothetical protein
MDETAICGSPPSRRADGRTLQGIWNPCLQVGPIKAGAPKGTILELFLASSWLVLPQADPAWIEPVPLARCTPADLK